MISLTEMHAGFRGKRVLVTGGSGFLGSHLVRRLVALGAQVYILVRSRSLLRHIADIVSDATVLLGDIRVQQQMNAAVVTAQPEVIFHLAAHGVDPQMRDPVTITQTNVIGMVNLLEASIRVPYERLVNTGTCFEYGNQEVPISESVMVDPLNVYAASKVMALHLCNLHRRFHGKPIVTVRPFTFFGPYERADRLIPSVILSILAGRPIRITSGVQTRDYTYVEDMVSAFMNAAVAEKVVGEVINVGSGEDISVREIAERIRDLMRADVPLEVGTVETKPDEAWRLCADSSKARAVLEWRPSLTFEEGLRRTIHWFSQNNPSSNSLRSNWDQVRGKLVEQ